MIELKDIAKSFSQGEQSLSILKDLNLSIAKGECVAILGQSGSGKSTLLSLLAALSLPDRGRIQINGIDLKSLDGRGRSDFRAQNIGIVFQQFHLLPKLRAWENVSLALEIRGEQEGERRAKALLSELGLAKRVEHFPSELSGGECQRVAMARAIIASPPVLLADEPSGNLDQDTGESVMNLFFSLVKRHSMTSVLVTHSLALAERCDRSLRLSHGSLASL